MLLETYLRRRRRGGGVKPPKHRKVEKELTRQQTLQRRRYQNSVTSTWKPTNFTDFQTIQLRFEHMELQRILVPKMCVICDLRYILFIYLTWLQGEGEHKRSKQFYPRVRKGDHVRGIARHVYRERTLFQARQTLKKTLLNENRPKKKSDANTLDIPLGEEEVLGPTPPEQHHHMSKDVRHKVDVLRWVADNRDDPALKVGNSFIQFSCNETYAR